MAWIELHQAVWTHRKTFELAGILDIDETYAAAHLIRLWTWSLDNAPYFGDLSHLSNQEIAAAAGWKGDCWKFIEAMVYVRFLDSDLHIHDWTQYAHLGGPRSEMRRAWERIARFVSEQIFARDGYSCRHCGAGSCLTVDHIQPIARGGNNERSNLQTLCRSCNSRKGAR